MPNSISDGSPSVPLHPSHCILPTSLGVGSGRRWECPQNPHSRTCGSAGLRAPCSLVLLARNPATCQPLVTVGGWCVDGGAAWDTPNVPCGHQHCLCVLSPGDSTKEIGRKPNNSIDDVRGGEKRLFPQWDLSFSHCMYFLKRKPRRCPDAPFGEALALEHEPGPATQTWCTAEGETLVRRPFWSLSGVKLSWMPSVLCFLA